MRACPAGHLDDLPWPEFVHHGPTECPARLRLDQYGVTGEAALIMVKCLDCGASRSLGEAFGPSADKHITDCSGRHPHLRGLHETVCKQPARTIILGASNAWFPASVSVISVPSQDGELEQLVERRWRELQVVTSRPVLDAFLALDSFRQFRPFAADQVWDAIERLRQQLESPAPAATSLRPPEWDALTAKALPRGIDFKARAIAPKGELDKWLERVVLVDQMRLVQALVGFTRLEAPEEGDGVDAEAVEPAPLTKSALRWVPASESKGEGIFLQFREQAIVDWLAESEVQELSQRHLAAHLAELRRRGLRPDQRPFLGMRYVLLHSFSHALMRQIALECGYAAASLRERVYALEPTDEDGPMAGVLISTSAPDSEGTLGGVVRLGEQDQLAWHITEALRAATDCASDPYCAEHEPGPEDASLHGAACHACLFAPETSCERGNRYLDRNVLVQTFADLGAAFFDPAD